MERELRRYQNLLICVGTGVITFGFWSLIKGVMSLILFKDDINTFLDATLPPEIPPYTVILIIVIMFAIGIALDLILRLYVGLSARKDGFGSAKKVNRAYPVFAIILALISVTSFISDFSMIGSEFGGILDTVVTCIIDVTSVVMSIELFVGAIKVSSLKRKISAAKAEEGAS